MAARKYHESGALKGGVGRLGAAVLAALLVAPAASARAAEVCADALCLSYDAPWTRGEATDEAEQDSYTLTLDGALPGADSTQFFLPRRGTRLQTDAGRFRAQLERKWRSQYGGQAVIGPRTIDGRDWLVCRRPSLDGTGTVFQWVGLEADRAYNLVWIVPGHQESLPAAALALLTRLRWDGPGEARPMAAAPPVVAPADAPAPATLQTRVAGPTAQAGPEPPPAPALLPNPLPVPPLDPAPQPAQAAASPAMAVASAGVAPDASPPAPVSAAVATAAIPSGVWRLVRSLVARPGVAALDALFQLETQRHAGNGTLTGYGVRTGEASLEWFIEGFDWVPRESGGRQKKALFRYGWQAAWTPPPPVLLPGGDLPLELEARPVAGEGEPRGGLELRWQWLDLCAPDSARWPVYASLAQGRHAPLKQLLERRHKACPAVAGDAGPMTYRMAQAAEPTPLRQSMRLPVPATGNPAALPKGVRQVRVLALRFAGGGSVEAPGDNLLRQSGVYYLYTREAGAEAGEGADGNPAAAVR